MAYDTAQTLSMVKARLNRLSSDTTLDAYLNSRINAAVEELARKGITLVDSSPDDMMFCVDYVVWQYQNRDTSGAMPEWLRLRRRERWLNHPQPTDEEVIL
ncbi:MAG: hypothetical protein PHY64_00280 [Eubacteriales bacterium]|nr:hypothetical protein [Eubacteriales bacterium]